MESTYMLLSRAANQGHCLVLSQLYLTAVRRDRRVVFPARTFLTPAGARERFGVSRDTAALCYTSFTADPSRPLY